MCIICGFLSDASPAALRKQVAGYGFITGIIGTLSIPIGEFSHIFYMMREEKIMMGKTVIHLSVQNLYALLNLFIYACRNIWMSYWYPDYMMTCTKSNELHLII